jgi:sialate O-acetylesterase
MMKLQPAILISFILVFQTTFCEVRLPHLLSDGMVLQRNTKVNIWGWASPGEKINLQFRYKDYSSIANTDGKWKVVIFTMKEGGPFSMKIDGSNHLVINNILVGDVWICSGQSNMVISMERVKEKYPEEIAGSENPFIRHFFLPTRDNFNKAEEDVPSGKWESANPKTVLQFTAAGYFFAKKLYEKYHVPIGLINSSVGGPPVESWISEDALKKFPEYLQLVQKFKDSLYVDSIHKKSFSINNEWNNYINQHDSGLTGNKPWYDTTYNADGWPTMQIPGYWDDQGLKGVNGVVWFRKELGVPASMAGKAAKLFVGRIVDADYTYINGSLVGNITYQYPPRIYEIASTLLKPGKNTITIRVINSAGKGGFVFDKPYYLTAGGETINLKGNWQYKTGVVSPALVDNTVNILYQPSGLFNAMIAPLINYTIKGVIWYQGEGNISRPYDYHKLFAAMITDWRKNWKQGNFPFLYVQLPNFGEVDNQPSESNWAELREQQLKTQSVSNTAMVVAIDLGEWNDLHPLNKKDVGKRLALAAENLVYGDKKIVYSGPMYQSIKIEKNKIIISFINTGSGLITKKGDALKQFAIAGTNKKFVWANAKIEGGKVVVWNDDIQKPVYVRYAWADNPGGANLYNKEGLPASPFRTGK